MSCKGTILRGITGSLNLVMHGVWLKMRKTSFLTHRPVTYLGVTSNDFTEKQAPELGETKMLLNLCLGLRASTMTLTNRSHSAVC